MQTIQTGSKTVQEYTDYKDAAVNPLHLNNANHTERYKDTTRIHRL